MRRIGISHIIPGLLFALLALTECRVQMRFQRCDIVVYNTSVLQNGTCVAKAINRTTTLVNASAFIARELHDINLNLQMFKKTEVTYRPFQINVTENWCDFVGMNRASTYLRVIAAVFLPFTNLNHSCPYYGPAVITNLPLNSKTFSEFWPAGLFRLDVAILESKLKFATLRFNLEIKEERLWQH